MLPPRPFLDTLVLRVAVVWAVLRAVVAVSVTPGGSGDGVALAAAFSAAWISMVVVAVVRIDMARRSELVLLANLGHRFRGIAALSVVQVFTMEALVGVVLG